MNLINADCIKFLQETSMENCVDCIITDPPYNISRKTNFDCNSGGGQPQSLAISMDYGEWDKQFDVTEFINYLPKVLKDNANVVIFNSWQNLHDIHVACERNNIFIKRCLVVNKTNPVPINRERLFANDVEFALWGVYSSKGNPTKWTFNRQDSIQGCVFTGTVQHSPNHTTPKDESVISQLVKILSNKGDVVLDCFMGSGTTGISCLRNKRNFVGIEINPEYFAFAKKRIEHFQAFNQDIVSKKLNDTGEISKKLF